MTQRTDTQVYSDDVAHLYAQYRKAPQRYHEIHLQEAIATIYDRWPLLRDMDREGEKCCD